MKAVVLEEFGDVSKLRIEEVEDPEVCSGEVLVQVCATSINPVDWKIRSCESKDGLFRSEQALPGGISSAETARARLPGCA